MYGQELDTFKLAILGSRNRVRLQIFEFVTPRYNGPEERPTYDRIATQREASFTPVSHCPNTRRRLQLLRRKGAAELEK